MFLFFGYLRNEDFFVKELIIFCRRVNVKVSFVDRINCSKYGYILYIEIYYGNIIYVTWISW